MATPHLTRHRLAGALGAILVDVRTGDRAASRPAVLVVHGFKGFKDWGMFPPFCERLARAGFTAVSCNLSGSGVDDSGEFVWPERFGRNTYSHELHDILAVVDAITGGRLGFPAAVSLGLVGHSRGGGMAILAAERDRRITRLVTWAAIGTVDRWSGEAKAAWRKRGAVSIHNSRTGQDFPLSTEVLDDIDHHAGGSLDILAAAARVAVPWLIIHGEDDESVDPADARALHAASGGKAELLLIPGTGHTFGAAHPWQGITPALEQVYEASVRRLSA